MTESDFTKDNLWMLPDGVDELLPPQSWALETLRRRVLDCFQAWGYELVVPPAIEFLDSLLTGVAGFCAPVFDAQGRMAMGVVVLGSVSTFDSRWDGPLAQALLRSTRQLSADLGYRPAG